MPLTRKLDRYLHSRKLHTVINITLRVIGLFSVKFIIDIHKIDCAEIYQCTLMLSALKTAIGSSNLN